MLRKEAKAPHCGGLWSFFFRHTRSTVRQQGRSHPWALVGLGSPPSKHHRGSAHRRRQSDLCILVTGAQLSLQVSSRTAAKLSIKPIFLLSLFYLITSNLGLNGSSASSFNPTQPCPPPPYTHTLFPSLLCPLTQPRPTLTFPFLSGPPPLHLPEPQALRLCCLRL